MPIELTRGHLLIGVFIASLLALFLVSGQSAPPALISTWAGQPAPPANTANRPEAITGTARPSTNSVPLSLAGDVGFNVLSALGASGGALRSVTISPGATWSFNATVGNPAQVVVRSIANVPGGGWCDLASRYVQAVRPLLPHDAVQFVNHVTTTGIRLADVSDDDAVSIWNVDGQAGSVGQSQDLQITNTLAAPLHLRVVEQPGQQIVVQASVSDQ
jgi:hypothetical protein